MWHMIHLMDHFNIYSRFCMRNTRSLSSTFVFLIIPVTFILFLSACIAPISKEELRHQANYKIDFEVERPYQQVFSDLLAQTRTCYLNKPQVRQITVVGDRDNALKTAIITVEEVYAMAGHDAYLVIDVTSKNENLTQVSAYLSRGKDAKEVSSIKSWAKKENNTCDVNWLD